MRLFLPVVQMPNSRIPGTPSPHAPRWPTGSLTLAGAVGGALVGALIGFVPAGLAGGLALGVGIDSLLNHLWNERTER